MGVVPLPLFRLLYFMSACSTLIFIEALRSLAPRTLTLGFNACKFFMNFPLGVFLDSRVFPFPILVRAISISCCLFVVVRQVSLADVVVVVVVAFCL